MTADAQKDNTRVVEKVPCDLLKRENGGFPLGEKLALHSGVTAAMHRSVCNAWKQCIEFWESSLG